MDLFIKQAINNWKTGDHARALRIWCMFVTPPGRLCNDRYTRGVAFFMERTGGVPYNGDTSR